MRHGDDPHSKPKTCIERISNITGVNENQILRILAQYYEKHGKLSNMERWISPNPGSKWGNMMNEVYGN